MEGYPVSVAAGQTYSASFDFQNKIAQSAIQSLDSLNDQIVQYIFSPKIAERDSEKDLSLDNKDTLKSSMVLIRRLLTDAQSKFRNMVEDNKQLACRIDGSIQAANQEVSVLRAELADTNKRLTEISVAPGMLNETSPPPDYEEIVKTNGHVEDNELVQLREDNARLETQVRSMTREIEELRQNKVQNSQQPSYGELKLQLIQTKQELNRAKEALKAMKCDRKRLKSEKLDLLNQLKQLYGTLEDKEAELRDFIRNYELRMKESDESIKQLAVEKDDTEREKWEIIKRARDAAERTMILRSQLDNKEQQLSQIEADLAKLKDHCATHNHRGSLISDSLLTRSSLDTTSPSDDLPPYETPPSSARYKNDSILVMSSSPDLEKGDSLTPLLNLLNSSQNLSDIEAKKKKRKSLSSLSKVFGKSRNRRSIAVPCDPSLDESNHPSYRISLLNQDNYQEKLKIVDQSKGIHMTNWRANQVLAWLEIVLSMPMYGKQCSENVKSGKVLLGLSDSELGSALGINNQLHRRKLRLAVEEQRDPGEIKFPKSSSLDHTWIAHRWVRDLGLQQYKSIFDSQLIDGRLLHVLSKKDLEKHLNIHRKFHQSSIIHAIELLRRLGFSKDTLMERRSKCEHQDTDPLVWSNQRVIQWVKSVDLQEYAENLVESGVHGALMVLEPSFTADTLSTALGISPSKSYVRRHLASELDALIKPARLAIETIANGTRRKTGSGGSLGRSFSRSFRASDDDVAKNRLSWRGSFSKAMSKKSKDDLRLSFDAETSRRKKIISAPILQSSFNSDILKTESTAV